MGRSPGESPGEFSGGDHRRKLPGEFTGGSHRGNHLDPFQQLSFEQLLFERLFYCSHTIMQQQLWTTVVVPTAFAQQL